MHKVRVRVVIPSLKAMALPRSKGSVAGVRRVGVVVAKFTRGGIF